MRTRGSQPRTSAIKLEAINPRPSRPALKRKRSTSVKVESKSASVKVEPSLTRGSAKLKNELQEPSASVSDIEDAPPKYWHDLLSTAKDMRSSITSPVDLYGCSALPLPSSPAPVRRFCVLTSLLLSSRTLDPTTASVVRRLQADVPGGLSPASLLAHFPSPIELAPVLRPIGFYNTKARSLLAVARICHEQYNDDIPDNLQGLLALPGIGPKMAYICLTTAWDRVEGVGVDSHVHRVVNRWGWVDTVKKGGTPEDTRKSLERWLPKEEWGAFNVLVVGFGQMVCKPVGRRCGGCAVGQRGLCPSRTEDPTRKTDKSRLKSVKDETEVEPVPLPNGGSMSTKDTTVKKEEETSSD